MRWEIRILRVIKVLWLILCISLAAWGTSAEGEANIVAIYFVGLFTAPAGLVIYVLGALILSTLSNSNSSLHDFAVNFVVYSLAISAGYSQWFVLLPKITERLKSERSPIKWGLVALSLIVVFWGLYRFYVHVFPSQHL